MPSSVKYMLQAILTKLEDQGGQVQMIVYTQGCQIYVLGNTYSVSRPGWPGSNDCVWPGVSNSLTTRIPRILNYCMT